ncbi:RNA 2',3'-cyclic phosphodiesterase [Oscillochloris sp. ZM17-4]|uniref:RNA 2',3'-cyclic phosphodiesterase n=1 Tax=Oscillochloris sp. ZM17-4 TaxID=2866714 RepID=UPI001C737E1A|nr:RNA 2',3'-cyclic phosphodiesterase [Oscillochloris sp. ZM17-4]MBX0327295.1 RNA 2',3'-cyclic phosphodiesterase [Oscillochloris sp. ZM17-4]
MRLFIALDLPDHARAALAEAQSRLRRCGHAVRWAAVDGLHLTLQFLGEADPARVPDLLAALAAIPAPAFPLRLGGLGAFPSSARPRVIWAGLAGDLGALGALQRAVTDATAPLGFIPEDRPFAPHLTLGRARQDVGAAQIDALAAALRAAAPPAPVAWDVGRPLLFESRSTPQGVVYTIVAT